MAPSFDWFADLCWNIVCADGSWADSGNGRRGLHRPLPEEPRGAEVSRFVADTTRARARLGLPMPEDPLFGLEKWVADTMVR